MIGEMLLVLSGVALGVLLVLVKKDNLRDKYPAIWLLEKRREINRRKRKREKTDDRKPNMLERYVTEAHDAGWRIRKYELLGYVVAGAAAGVGFGMFVDNEYVSVLGLSGGYILPAYLLYTVKKKRQAAISYQFESAINSMASSFGVYGNVVDAIRSAVQVMESPIKDEFVRVLQETDSGVPLKKALQNMEQRVGRRELVMFNRVMTVAESSGGGAGEVLQKCARIIAENRLLRLDLEAEVAQAKQDTRVMFMLTVGAVVFFRLTNSELFTFYSTPAGKFVMLALLALGAFVTYKANKSADLQDL